MNISENLHTQLVDDCLVKLSEYGYLAWKQQVGTFRRIYDDSVIKIGVEGMADIGAISPLGDACQFECKTGAGKQSKEQISWERAVNKRGRAKYLVVRSVNDIVHFCEPCHIPPL